MAGLPTSYSIPATAARTGLLTGNGSPSTGARVIVSRKTFISLTDTGCAFVVSLIRNRVPGIGTPTRHAVLEIGSGHRRMQRPNEGVHEGVWSLMNRRSPDGRTRVYSTEAGLHLVQIDDKHDQRVTSLGSYSGLSDKCPSFSPDGGRIAFARELNGNAYGPTPRNVILMDADGGDQQAVASKLNP